MAQGLGERLEHHISCELATWRNPWRRKKRSGRFEKLMKARRERHRARRDPECQPHYAFNWGFEW
jgi:hypothetical protein